jgi:glycosyltransferase involved in cell wall biosynthesis
LVRIDLMPAQSASIIIPTFNRSDLLFNCLSSLDKQAYPNDNYEIIVVDDGSLDRTREVVNRQFPRCRYLYQSNQGQASALNNGALNSCGDILILMDDDIVVESHFLARVMQFQNGRDKTLLLPLVVSACANPRTTFTQVYLSADRVESVNHQMVFRKGNFTDLIGCCFAIRRKDFFDVGGMRSPAVGLWPDWNDLEFAYRAKLNDIEFVICENIMIRHYESGFRSLDAACMRSHSSGVSATHLLKMHPELIAHIPMFRDKLPIVWIEDSPPLIVRKVARQISASLPFSWAMIRIVRLFERCCPNRHILLLLYRWIIGGYIYRGYREGLRKCARARSENGGC